MTTEVTGKYLAKLLMQAISRLPVQRGDKEAVRGALSEIRLYERMDACRELESRNANDESAKEYRLELIELSRRFPYGEDWEK